MNIENLISVHTLISHYKIEMSFITNLNELGLLEIEFVEESPYIHQDKIASLEKIIRLHHELELNLEGIDVVLNLLNKLIDLQNELLTLKNKLQLYEN